MVHKRTKLGQWGEELAYQYLCEAGYRILERNYQCSLGEIDLIAEDGDTLVFVEVKTRTSHAYGAPQTAVGWKKQTKLKQLAWHYLLQQRYRSRPCRFDVVAITLPRGATSPHLELIQNAFQLEEG